MEVTAKMHDADVLVFATPVYYYSVSGQLKTMLDRANRCTTRTMPSPKPTCWRRRRRTSRNGDGTRTAVQGWVDCFPRCELAETVFAGGVNDVGDIAGHPALEKAYQPENPFNSGIFTQRKGRIPLTGNAAFEIDSLSERQARITGSRMAACAAARRAMGTRKGLQET